MTRTFWLSFADERKPAGQQHLGCCVVDIDDDDLGEARDIISMDFPRAQPGAELVLAATLKARLMACNPGGQVVCVEITAGPPELVADMPRDRLFTIEELAHYGGRIDSHTGGESR